MFRPSLEGFDLVQRVDVEVPGFGFYHVVAGMLGIGQFSLNPCGKIVNVE